jgi:hypothetical protein
MVNYKYKVHKVGDALFSIYSSKEENGSIKERSIFDIGYSNKTLFENAIKDLEYLDSKTLLLSHFHKDHFQGLEQLGSNKLTIEKVIIPRLPFDNTYAEGVIAFTAIQLFYLAEKTGFYETDILNLIARQNKCTFKVERLKRGDKFIASQVNFDVIWPDYNYLIKLKAVREGVSDVIKVAEQNPEFKKFYEAVIASNAFNLDSITINPNETAPNEFKIILSKEERDLLSKASERLLSKANDICLAFHDEERKFLSLGDLSDSALNKLFTDDFKTKVTYEVFLSAHHGTHYSTSPNWNNITSCVVVHSNGKKMSKYFRDEYLPWSISQCQTQLNKGCFDSKPYLIECRLSKLLDKKKAKSVVKSITNFNTFNEH